VNNKDPETDSNIQNFLHNRDLSPLKKYAILTVGSSSVLSFLNYEIITSLLAGFPGALGYYLRQKIYKYLFKAVGGKPTIGRNVVIRGGKKIVLGDAVHIDDQCVLDARGPRALIRIEDNVVISRNTMIRARNGEIVLKKGADIGCNCLLGTNSRILIGSDVLIAAYTYISGAGSHNYNDKSTPIIKQGTVEGSGVVIEDDSWLGARTTVLDGVTIGKGSIVGAHSLVKSSLPEMSISFGNPAKIQRFR
jgi:galactoside O-acetyltransferase